MSFDSHSIEIRKEIINVISKARRGHLGSAFSIVEILRVFYDTVLRYNPKRPKWKARDRFILSKGHGCLALYVILAKKGYFPKSELAKFCRYDGILGGHPQAGKVPGVEWSTGSLGHGLPVGVGMALAVRSQESGIRLEKEKNRFPTPRVYILLGDGECNEGSVWEAAQSASKHHLDNLCVLIDYNKMMTYGSTAVIQNIEPLKAKWESFGFHVQEVDGHNMQAVEGAIRKAWTINGKPQTIICHTIKGKGIPFIENVASWHHKTRFPDEEIQRLYNELDR